MNTTDAYNALLGGHVFQSIFLLYDNLLQQWFVPILFIVYQVVLLIKTRNLTLSWITGIFFVVMYSSSYLVKQMSLQIVMILLVFELAAILYLVVFK